MIFLKVIFVGFNREYVSFSNICIPIETCEVFGRSDLDGYKDELERHENETNILYILLIFLPV